MLEFAAALQLLMQQSSPAAGTLSRRERQELRRACEQFVAEQPGKLIDLRGNR